MTDSLIRTGIKISALALLAFTITACGAKEQLKDSGSVQLATSSTGTAKPTDGESPVAELRTADPDSINAFLREEKLKNGDIYLEGSVVHVNIVDLTPKITAAFEAAFTPSSYRLHNVRYSIEELREAQDTLRKNELYTKLNLYGSSLDVINNQITITLPDDAADKIDEIETIVDKKFLTYDFVPLGEPQVVGKIAQIDSEQKRILVHEDGQEKPNMWFSFNSFSNLSGEDGQSITFTDFKLEQRLKAWTTGLVAESFPSQATARKIVLLNESPAENKSP